MVIPDAIPGQDALRALTSDEARAAGAVAPPVTIASRIAPPLRPVRAVHDLERAIRYLPRFPSRPGSTCNRKWGRILVDPPKRGLVQSTPCRCTWGCKGCCR